MKTAEQRITKVVEEQWALGADRNTLAAMVRQALREEIAAETEPLRRRLATIAKAASSASRDFDKVGARAAAEFAHSVARAASDA